VNSSQSADCRTLQSWKPTNPHLHLQPHVVAYFFPSQTIAKQTPLVHRGSPHSFASTINNDGQAYTSVLLLLFAAVKREPRLSVCGFHTKPGQETEPTQWQDERRCGLHFKESRSIEAMGDDLSSYRLSFKNSRIAIRVRVFSSLFSNLHYFALLYGSFTAFHPSCFSVPSP
jgi:hypothetical protein